MSQQLEFAPDGGRAPADEIDPREIDGDVTAQFIAVSTETIWDR